MICDNCIHNAVCAYGENRSNGFYCTGDKCKQFKDKDLFLELPVKPGTTVYYIQWDYTDDDFTMKSIYWIEQMPFEVWMLRSWGDYIFATEEEAAKRLEETNEKI